MTTAAPVAPVSFVDPFSDDMYEGLALDQPLLLGQAVSVDANGSLGGSLPIIGGSAFPPGCVTGTSEAVGSGTEALIRSSDAMLAAGPARPSPHTPVSAKRKLPGAGVGPAPSASPVRPTKAARAAPAAPPPAPPVPSNSSRQQVLTLWRTATPLCLRFFCGLFEAEEHGAGPGTTPRLQYLIDNEAAWALAAQGVLRVSTPCLAADAVSEVAACVAKECVAACRLALQDIELLRAAAARPGSAWATVLGPLACVQTTAWFAEALGRQVPKVFMDGMMASAAAPVADGPDAPPRAVLPPSPGGVASARSAAVDLLRALLRALQHQCPDRAELKALLHRLVDEGWEAVTRLVLASAQAPSLHTGSGEAAAVRGVLSVLEPLGQYLNMARPPRDAVVVSVLSHLVDVPVSAFDLVMAEVDHMLGWAAGARE
jgi:hypothetical protein